MISKVSVVIPTFNGGSLFSALLGCLRRQKYNGQIEIVVVDSGSTDGTVDVARQFGAIVAVIAPETFNHGLTRDQGISLSSGDIILLMTQDAVPGDEYLIANLCAPFEDPQVAGSYARQVPRADADIFTKRNLNSWLTGQRASVVRWIKDIEEYDSLSPMDKYMFCNFDNVCSAVRKSVWEIFPFGYNEFGEDIVWSKIVLEAGWKIAYQPDAYVVHSHDRSITYEYKRTYICHRTLNRLFGLVTIPSFLAFIVSIYFAIKTDWLYLLGNRSACNGLCYHFMRIPLLVIASHWAQYRGVRDEQNNTCSKIRGV